RPPRSTLPHTTLSRAPPPHTHTHTHTHQLRKLLSFSALCPFLSFSLFLFLSSFISHFSFFSLSLPLSSVSLGRTHEGESLYSSLSLSLSLFLFLSSFISHFSFFSLSLPLSSVSLGRTHEGESLYSSLSLSLSL